MVLANENYGPGGPPMVRIDGAEVRRIRERQGLTQLYVATVVQVTTDTISRWENRRYPTIKKENAEKLAEALGVALEELLEEEPLAEAGSDTAGEEETPAVSVSVVSPKANVAARLVPVRFWAGIFLLLIIGGLYWFLAREDTPTIPITANRVLPTHVPPGQSFPVLIRIGAPAESSLSLIVRENLPPGCRVLVANPPPTGANHQEGQLRWVSRLEKGGRLFSYLLVSPALAPEGQELAFNGQILVGGSGDQAIAIAGSNRLAIGPHHWADSNGDNRIDDEEILAVYDLYGEVDGFAGLRDEVDTLWAAGGYRWDEKTGKYLPEQ